MPKGFVEDCLLVVRTTPRDTFTEAGVREAREASDDTWAMPSASASMFVFRPDGVVVPTLRGYAIVPREEWEVIPRIIPESSASARGPR